jgi:hypothetical protein
VNSVPSTKVIAAAMEYRKQQDEKDPVRWYVLQCPDGSTTGDIVEMHVSEAARRNESRMASYMASEQRRKEARKEWLAKREENNRLNRIAEFAQVEVAQRARTAEVPIPERASELTRKLVANRKLNPAPVEVPIFASDPEPIVSYTAADYLWTRTLDARGKVIRVEGTRRGRHD